MELSLVFLFLRTIIIVLLLFINLASIYIWNCRLIYCDITAKSLWSPVSYDRRPYWLSNFPSWLLIMCEYLFPYIYPYLPRKFIANFAAIRCRWNYPDAMSDPFKQEVLTFFRHSVNSQSEAFASLHRFYRNVPAFANLCKRIRASTCFQMGRHWFGRI